MYISDAYREKLARINQVIWESAEVKFEEYRSAKALCDFLEAEGYQVERGVAGIETAFVATLGSGKPVIGLLAEYDALSGLSQQANCPEPKKRPETTCGHGCGHNLLATGIMGGALLLRDYLQAHPHCGTIKIIGCPAEEGGSGKAYMARAGVFNDLDLALTWHPGSMNSVMTGRLIANVQAAFSFTGKASHAGAMPQMGRSALDAVELMDVGVNYLREHMEMTDRIHYAILDTGGVSPNVVQAHAEVLYLIRSETSKGATALFERVKKIARGAALMTETQVQVRFDNAVSEVVPNDVVAQTAYEHMLALGVPKRTEEQKAYLKQFQATVTPEMIIGDKGMKPDVEPEVRQELIKDNPMGEFIIPHVASNGVITASSDMGDVSYIAPLLQFHTACFAIGTPAHSWQWVAQGTSSVALDGVCYAAKAISDIAINFLEDAGLLARAQAELKKRLHGSTYVCPIPPEVQPSKYSHK